MFFVPFFSLSLSLSLTIRFHIFAFLVMGCKLGQMPQPRLDTQKNLPACSLLEITLGTNTLAKLVLGLIQVILIFIILDAQTRLDNLPQGWIGKASNAISDLALPWTGNQWCKTSLAFQVRVVTPNCQSLMGWEMEKIYFAFEMHITILFSCILSCDR